MKMRWAGHVALIGEKWKHIGEHIGEKSRRKENIRRTKT
jgi:hypothetical protein